MSQQIFITGGAGFIGANLAAHYLSEGSKVVIYDNLSRPGVTHNLDWLQATYPKRLIKVYQEDIRDRAALSTAIVGSDVIFHLAGQTAVTTSIQNPLEDFEINAVGTLNLLETIRLKLPQAILIYASTNKVYGDVARISAVARGRRYTSVESASIDESEQLDFYSPYGCSKGAGDQYVRDYHRIYGLNTIVFRQSCIYGAHQFGVEDQGWVAHFTAQAIKRQPITIYGDGKQVRDMLYITDLVQAYHLAVKHIKITSGQVYNIGGGVKNTISLLELIDQLSRLTGQPLTLKKDLQRRGDQKIYVSNIDKAVRDLGWTPEVGITEGVNLLYTWLEQFLAEKTHGSKA